MLSMKKLLILFFLCVSFASIGQNKKLDSLYQVLESNSKEDSIKVKLVLTIARVEFINNNHGKMLSLAEEALSISKKTNYDKGIGKCYTFLAVYYKSIGDFDKVADYAMKMLEIYEHSTDYEQLERTYTILGLVHDEWGDYEKAKFYHEKSLAISQKTGRKIGMSAAYTNLGIIFSKTKKYDKAIECFSKSLALDEGLRDTTGISTAFVNLAINYQNKENYPSAISYFEKSLSLAKKVNDWQVISSTYEGLAMAYAKTGQYKKGLSYADSSLVFAKKLMDKTLLRDSYSTLATIEKLQNNFKSAITYIELSAIYKDSIFSDNKIKQTTDLEKKYETEKKEKEIQLLEQKTKTQNLWRNSLVVGLLFTLVSATIIYLLQRSRTRKAKLLLETQQLLNHQMQEADKIKSRLFANISHEFRTPLTLILSPVEEKLLSEDLSQKDNISFQSIRRSANQLLELINQVLELSKLESGFMKLKAQSGNLYNFIMPILSSFDSMADVGQVRYTKEVRIPESTVLFDGDKVEKILNNLLANAFRFSPKAGRVEVRIVAAEKEKSVELAIEIKNTSVIPPAALDKIFEPFFQGENAPVRGVQGTGLGLSLVKELVKLHGGDIQVSSHADEGTTFTVMLAFEKSTMPTISPAEKPEAAALAEGRTETNPVETDSAKETILIVEDNQEVRMLIRQGLQIDYNILEASTGKEGVTMAHNHSIDIVVSDVMMPVMNGMELCHLLKNDERTSHLPIILLTARADHESKLEGLRTGADDYVVKPFNMQELQARISNLIAQRKKLIQKYNQRIVVQPHEITVTPLDERFIQKAIEFVEANLDDPELTVEKMLEGMGMSRTNLNRKIKAITGLSTNEFIQDFRLRRAAMLIEKKADTISQIAYQVGFNDQSYFTRCFKKKFGKTPSEYASHA
jgi:signal transduction histidine kinase/DNA-binding response OmpR family regulator